MSELIKISLGQHSSVGPGWAVEGQAGAPTAMVTVQGSGNVSATVVIQGSNDGAAWRPLLTLSPSGAGVDESSGSWVGDYALLRMDVTQLSDGAQVSAVVAVDQTGSVSNVAQGAAGGPARPTIGWFGSSSLHAGNYGWFAPFPTTNNANIPGVTVVALQRKAASGSLPLVYNAAERTLTYNGGPTTAIVDGYQVVPGPTPEAGIAVVCRTAILGSSNVTNNVTRQGTRPDEILGGKSVAGWTNAFSRQSYLMRIYAHTGGWTMDGPSIVERADDFDAFVLHYHSNDIQGERTLAQLQADTIALLDAAYSKSRSKRGVAIGCSNIRNGWTAAQQEIADQYNRWLPGALRAYPGVVARFPWDVMTTDDGVTSNQLMMDTDDVHPRDAGAQRCGKMVAEYFREVLPGTAWDFGAAAGKWSATNPGGNLLKNPHPAGDNSGRPTGWGALSTLAGLTTTPTKVARTDGVPGSWAQIEAVTDETFVPGGHSTFSIPNAMFEGAPSNGDVVQAFVEFEAEGPQLVPTLMLSEIKGGSVVVYARVNNNNTSALQESSFSGVLAIGPYVWSDAAGVSNVGINAGIRPIPSSTAKLRIGRIWFGTPDTPTIY